MILLACCALPWFLLLVISLVCPQCQDVVVILAVALTIGCSFVIYRCLKYLSSHPPLDEYPLDARRAHQYLPGPPI